MRPITLTRRLWPGRRRTQTPGSASADVQKLSRWKGWSHSRDDGRPQPRLAERGRCPPTAWRCTIRLRPERNVSRRTPGRLPTSFAMLLEAICRTAHGTGVRGRRRDPAVGRPRGRVVACGDPRRSCSKRSRSPIQQPGAPTGRHRAVLRRVEPTATSRDASQRHYYAGQAGDRPDRRSSRTRSVRRPGPTCCAVRSTCCTRSAVDALDSLSRRTAVKVFTFHAALPVRRCF